MATDLGNAYVNIVPKAPGIKNNISNLLGGGGDGAEKAGAGLGKRLLKGIAALGIGVAVGSMVKQAFQAGGALQQSFGGLDTIYVEAAEGAKQYAMAAAAAGISANDYAEQAVSFGAALKAAYGGDTTAAMEAANTALMDMADNAAKMGTPIESLQSAYAGFAKQNYTMLDNLKLGYGGTKSEMERLLKDAQKISGVKYDISNLGDIYEAIHVIQGELGLTGVAADEAKTTLTGSMGAMKASWTNLMGALTTGQGLKEAMSGLSESVGNFANVVLSMFGELAPQLPDMILGLVDIFIDNAPAFISAGGELILKLITGLVSRIPDIAAKVPEIAASFKAAFTAVDWKSLGLELINAIGAGLTQARDYLKPKLKAAFDKAKTALKEIDWKQLGKDIINGIMNGLSAAAGSLYRKLRDIIRKGLTNAEDEAEVGSPSRLFAREVGRWIPAGIAMGVDEESMSVNAAVRRAVDSAVISPQNVAQTAAAPAQNDADRIIEALRQLKVVADVSLEGDARGIFRAVNKTNIVRTKATNYNVLAAGG